MPKATSSTLQSYRDPSQQRGMYVFQQTPDATPGQFIATPRVYRTVKLGARQIRNSLASDGGWGGALMWPAPGTAEVTKVAAKWPS